MFGSRSRASTGARKRHATKCSIPVSSKPGAGNGPKANEPPDRQLLPRCEHTAANPRETKAAHRDHLPRHGPRGQESPMARALKTMLTCEQAFQADLIKVKVTQMLRG
ncbi:hypothetical protein GCM10025778_31970 [Paeniglutamicibacter antarcticus]|uniref:Uncharacterized protein n=1 Tax=Paeniglutamicibacter antarcticus TaxID=494023 RepID=A0ABP9TSB2_9MICC